MSDSSADFFPREQFASICVSGQRCEPGVCQMAFLAPFVGRLGVVTAYIAIAFVGAIVLGVI